MAENTVRGRFVWHELMTPDTAGAQGFYSKVLGWKTQAWEHDPNYSMFLAPSGPLGGAVSLPSGAPQWLHYISTADIDATVAEVKRRGGRVTKEITSMPSGGKYAILSDPQGAAFAVYASGMEGGKEAAPKHGEFSWHELTTTDHKAAFDFYAGVFGWRKLKEHDMGAMGTYVIFGNDGVRRGGMFNKPPQMQGGPAWLGYVRVKSVEDVVKKAKGARGTLINGPMEVPGGDWVAQFIDPYGAMFAVHAFAADVQSAQPAASSAAPREEAQTQPSAKPAARAAASTAPGGKKKARKKAPAKKASAKKAPAKKAAKKKRAAAKAARRPARKAAGKAGARGKKATKGRRAGGRKKVARKPRKAK